MNEGRRKMLTTRGWRLIPAAAAIVFALGAAVAAGTHSAVAAGVSGGSSSASGAATTLFKGRFVCGRTPLAGARVELLGEPRTYSSFLGIRVDDFKVGFNLRGTVYAGDDGEWSFRVPRTSDTNYFIQVSLDDGRGTIVTQYPSLSASAVVPGRGGTNFNDVPLQDFGTQAYPGEECRLWRALKDAYRDYAHLMGKRPPYGTLVAQYDAPNKGTPYTDYTTIVWPAGFPVLASRPRHEFWHTIRNASLGSEAAFLDEVSVTDPMLRGSPCSRTSAQSAFHEGWAEFWAGDYYPAPKCAGTSPLDQTVEGTVAWTLTRIAHNCAAVSPRRMVETLLAHGSKIHSLSDFERELGVGSASCAGAPVDPNTVPRTKVAPPVSGERSLRDAQARLAALGKTVSTLNGLLPGADRAAASARCPRPPCPNDVGRKLTPDLIRGRIAQARAAASILQTDLSIDAQSVRGRPTRKFLESVTRTPAVLATRMARIGAHNISNALAAARPLATRDHSHQTRSVLNFFRSQRAALVRSAQVDTEHPFRRTVPDGCGTWVCWLGWSEGEKKTKAVPTIYSHTLQFDSADKERRTVTFGSPTALGFPGTVPKYVCAGTPDLGVRSGWAVTPSCDAPDLGVAQSHTGMMARLTYPARSVWASLGATQAIPGGLAAELDGFDSTGKLVSQTAVLVASSTNDGHAWEPRLLTLTPSLHAHAIVFIALYVNHPISSAMSAVGADSQKPRLAIDALAYEEKQRSP